MAAGVLFHSIAPDGKTRVFLLGREKHSTGYRDSLKSADFGGKIEESDVDIDVTASRECYEEMMGVVATYPTILSRLRSREITAAYDIRLGNTQGYYRMYLLRIPYDDYGAQFARMTAYFDYTGITVNSAEKASIEWYEVDTLMQHARDCLEHNGPEMRRQFSRDCLERPDHGGAELRKNFAHSLAMIARHVDLSTLE